MTDTNLVVRCAKYGCRRRATTYELEVGPGAETFPNALCPDHAWLPHRLGTLEQPTIVQAEARRRVKEEG